MLCCSAVAAHLSRELPYEVTAGDVVITAGCNHAIEVMMAVLAAPGANVLLPRPGYPMYQSRASLCGLEFRNFDLLPDKGWEVDLDGVEAIADENTVAMVIVNPNNPCGCVYSYDHLAEVSSFLCICPHVSELKKSTYCSSSWSYYTSEIFTTLHKIFLEKLHFI
jgi:tyrosine aminotransferase